MSIGPAIEPGAEALAKLVAQRAPESQSTRLQNLVSLAAAERDFQALALVGSYARGNADHVSDLDLVGFTTAGRGAALFGAASAVLDGPVVLNRFAGTHGAFGWFGKFVYVDFTSVELHVFEPDARFRLRRPYLAVWDPVDRLREVVVDGEPIRHEDFSAYEHGDDGLVWELVDCIKWLTRGRTGLARQHLRKMVAAMDASAGSSG